MYILGTPSVSFGLSTLEWVLILLIVIIVFLWINLGVLRKKLELMKDELDEIKELVIGEAVAEAEGEIENE